MQVSFCCFWGSRPALEKGRTGLYSSYHYNSVNCWGTVAHRVDWTYETHFVLPSPFKTMWKRAESSSGMVNQVRWHGLQCENNNWKCIFENIYCIYKFGRSLNDFWWTLLCVALSFTLWKAIHRNIMVPGGKEINVCRPLVKQTHAYWGTSVFC